MAGRKKATEKPKPAKKKANGKPRKPSAAEMSDLDRQKLLFSYKRKIKPLLAAKKIADDNVRKMFEQAKKEGVSKKEIELAIAFESEAGEEKFGNEVERIVRVARWMGVKNIGTQLDLFAKQSPGDEAYEDGKRAALDDQPRKPPTHLSNASAQRWMAGFDEGRAAMNEERAQGFKPIGAVASTLIGTEPPTHAVS